MQVHLPKPLHGWREFAGEVGIIVLGVLIALAAQRVVETIHGNAQAREFRQAVDDELAYDLGSYKQRLLLSPCVQARLAELDRVIASYRAGKPMRMRGLSRLPVGFSLRTSVWAGRTDDVVSRLPLWTRLSYASIYDDLTNYDIHRVDERNAWQELGDFDDAKDLSNDDLMRLRGLVSKLRWIDFIINSNWPEEAERGRRFGIYPKRDPRDPVLDRGVCTTYLLPTEVAGG
jgi:hypothetical protein